MMDKESKKELFFILSFGVSSRLPVRCVSFIMNTDLMSWSYGFFKIVSNRRSFCSLRKREREREREMAHYGLLWLRGRLQCTYKGERKERALFSCNVMKH